MRTITLGLLCVCFLSCASTKDEVTDYLEFLSRYKDLIGPFEGEVRIVRDPRKIRQAQENFARLSRKKGLHAQQVEASQRLGVVAEDAYLLVIRDAVEFPDGHLGMYARVMDRNRLQGKHVGSIILPVDEQGRYGLIVTFRHPARSWELELPKGAADAGESFADAAHRELLEETGLQSQSMKDLGEVAFATIGPSRPRLFLARVHSQKRKKPQYDKAEVIHSVEWFDHDRMMQAYRRGFAIVPIRGENVRVPFRDPMLGHALLLAISHGQLQLLEKL